MRVYKPQPRSTAARAIAYLASPEAPAKASSVELAKACEVERDKLSTLLAAAVRHGALVKAHDDGRVYYSLPADQAATEATAAAPPEEHAPDGEAPKLEARLWLNGDLDIWPAQVLADGSGGVRLSAEEVREIVLLVGGGVLAP